MNVSDQSRTGGAHRDPFIMHDQAVLLLRFPIWSGNLLKQRNAHEEIRAMKGLWGLAASRVEALIATSANRRAGRWAIEPTSRNRLLKHAAKTLTCALLWQGGTPC